MYQDELRQEAKLIVQGQQALLRDLSEFLARVKTWMRSHLPRGHG